MGNKSLKHDFYVHSTDVTTVEQPKNCMNHEEFLNYYLKEYKIEAGCCWNKKSGKNMGKPCGKHIKHDNYCCTHAVKVNKTVDRTNEPKVFCQTVLKSGDHIGEICGRIVKNGQCCWLHNKTAIPEIPVCSFILKSGQHKGQKCGRNINGGDCCWIHSRCIESEDVKEITQTMMKQTQCPRSTITFLKQNKLFPINQSDIQNINTKIQDFYGANFVSKIITATTPILVKYEQLDISYIELSSFASICNKMLIFINKQLMERTLYLQMFSQSQPSTLRQKNINHIITILTCGSLLVHPTMLKSVTVNESITPKVIITTPVIPKVTVQEPVTPKITQESVIPKITAQEPVILKVTTEEPVIPKVPTQVTVTPKITAEESVIPKIIAQESVIPKIINKIPEHLMSKGLKMLTVLQRHMDDPNYDKKLIIKERYDAYSYISAKDHEYGINTNHLKLGFECKICLKEYAPPDACISCPTCIQEIIQNVRNKAATSTPSSSSCSTPKVVENIHKTNEKHRKQVLRGSSMQHNHVKKNKKKNKKNKKKNGYRK